LAVTIQRIVAFIPPSSHIALSSIVGIIITIIIIIIIIVIIIIISSSKVLIVFDFEYVVG